MSVCLKSLKTNVRIEMFPFKQPALLLAAECELLHENTTL